MTNGWIGCDLDGTLAEYHGWYDGKIGHPVPRMLERVKRWVAAGIEVKIVTARVNDKGRSAGESAKQRELIQAWCLEHVGCKLPVTCCKDFRMTALYDDRAVQVVPNTGVRVDGLAD